MDQLSPYDFDQTAAGWASLANAGKHLAAAQTIERYIHTNPDKIAAQNKVSVQKLCIFMQGRNIATL